MSDVKLLPCPFCGSFAYLVTHYQGTQISARCGGCICDGPMKVREEAAIAAWNTRALTSEQQAAEEMAKALVIHEWTVEKRSLYDEEGIEGWAWIEPDGTEHIEIGSWNELPPWPETAHAALAKAGQQ